VRPARVLALEANAEGPHGVQRLLGPGKQARFRGRRCRAKRRYPRVVDHQPLT
jgi:hypothetical protein